MKIKTLTLFLITLFISISSFAQIAASRISTDWNKAGVIGGIPCWDKEVTLTNLVGDGSTDNSLLLTTAINAYKGTKTKLIIPKGTFRFNSRINIPREGNIMLVGAGPNQTILRFTVGNIKGHGLFNVNAGKADILTETSVNAGLIKGSKSLTVASASSISPGDWVEIDMANPSVITSNAKWNTSWANRCLGQIFKVVSKSGNTLTLDREVHITYPDPASTKLRKLNMTEWVGFENFKLEVISAATDEKYNVNFEYAANCWMKLIHSEKTVTRHVSTPNSANLSIKDCYFNDSYDHGDGGHGYGVVVDLHTTNCLIQNNIFNRLRHSMMCKLGANGNVFGYNYSRNPVWNYPTTAPDINMHGHLPHMNLFEGNIVAHIAADDVWGPAWDGTTYFRNRQYALDRDANFDGPNRGQNIVGNELVTPGKKIAIASLNVSTFTHANNLNGSISYASGASTTLEKSYYLAAKPNWWGGSKWPSIGPSNAINSGNNPAFDRYQSNQLFGAYYCGEFNLAPSVSLSAPANNTVVPVGSNVTLSATADDSDGSITSVAFYNGNTLLGTDNTRPYSYTINNLNSGTYTLKAVAKDNLGASSTSATVTLTVKTVNILTNGEFDNGTNGWVLELSNGAAATMTVITNGNLSGSNALKICPTKEGTANYHVQVTQDAPFQANKNYEISFIAKADAPRIIGYGIKMGVTPFTYYDGGSASLTTVGKTFKYTFTPTNSDPTAKFKIYAGLSKTCFTIDKIEFKQIASQAANSPSIALVNPTDVWAIGNEEKATLKYFPNPFEGEITVAKSGPFSYQIVDVLGKSIEHGNAEGEIKIGEYLKSGMYFLVIVQGDKKEVVKILKK